MTTAALDTMVASLTSTVDYLRIAIGAPGRCVAAVSTRS